MLLELKAGLTFIPVTRFSAAANLLETWTNLNFSNRFFCMCFFFLNYYFWAHFSSSKPFWHLFAPVNTLFPLGLTRCFSLQVQLPDSVFIDTTETSFVEKYVTYACNIQYIELEAEIFILPSSGRKENCFLFLLYIMCLFYWHVLSTKYLCYSLYLWSSFSQVFY